MDWLNYDVYFSNGVWRMATAICEENGCYAKSLPFPTKEEAIKEAQVRSNTGLKMDLVSDCTACR
ncbi:hypothetical protein JCM19046_3677 [Bacillus sp. JCM 19046]|nr:hypothetical protein JCM19045_1718 [Bacillus sp. JCM 19045]GAF19051.1 hypothetical protein JCM19046_3677 [Bacillus sp. JCM 19046]